MNCNECIHQNVCYRNSSELFGTSIQEFCKENFKNKTSFIELPVNVGDTVYYIWYSECKNGETHPDSWGCQGCTGECDMKRIVCEKEMQNIMQIISSIDKFDNGWYMKTKEEAEFMLNKNRGRIK